MSRLIVRVLVACVCWQPLSTLVWFGFGYRALSWEYWAAVSCGSLIAVGGYALGLADGVEWEKEAP